ncbi:hypothetical protein FIBSPDRAFT_552061 [Athelia psychrophila]|uniref:Uncharacterized protein n=1 Tax=Athelia psychrophila TaxID=1759441 RepID=A0A166UWD4_9AGAM|nr:hypothetical protein FIBSPDRAFT_552061 [Fibularhizoctonia sp. CBS 109695]
MSEKVSLPSLDAHFLPFNAASTRSSQPLFIPFIAPLDEKQKKSIRRVALLDAPNFHLGLHNDASWIISASKRSQEQRQAMANTHKRLGEIVKESELPGKPRRLEIALVGVDACIHGGVHDAPFEFALIDMHHPTGLPPGSPDVQLPAYDFAVLAGILAAHGRVLAPAVGRGPAPEEHRRTHLRPPTRPRLGHVVVA